MHVFSVLSICAAVVLATPLLSNSQAAVEAHDRNTPQQILTGQSKSDQSESAINTPNRCKVATLQHDDLSIDVTIYDTHGNSIGNITHARPPPSISAIDVSSQLDTVLSVFSARNFLRFQYGLLGWKMTTKIQPGSSPGCQAPVSDEMVGREKAFVFAVLTRW